MFEFFGLEAAYSIMVVVFPDPATALILMLPVELMISCCSSVSFILIQRKEIDISTPGGVDKKFSVILSEFMAQSPRPRPCLQIFQFCRRLAFPRVPFYNLQGGE